MKPGGDYGRGIQQEYSDSQHANTNSNFAKRPRTSISGNWNPESNGHVVVIPGPPITSVGCPIAIQNSAKHSPDQKADRKANQKEEQVIRFCDSSNLTGGSDLVLWILQVVSVDNWDLVYKRGFSLRCLRAVTVESWIWFNKRVFITKPLDSVFTTYGSTSSYFTYSL